MKKIIGSQFSRKLSISLRSKRWADKLKLVGPSNIYKSVSLKLGGEKQKKNSLVTNNFSGIHYFTRGTLGNQAETNNLFPNFRHQNYHPIIYQERDLYLGNCTLC